MNFDARNPWPDRELQGLEFIADSRLRGEWESWWPTSGNCQNWDAVGWWDEAIRKCPVLIEAKANVKEFIPNARPSSQGGRPRIEQSLQETAQSFGGH
jgi:hypothetical protein